MPMAKSEMLMVLGSSYQPNKFGNTTDVVGALHQDRFSGIMGELGAEAPIDSGTSQGALARQRQPVIKEKDFNFRSSSIRSGRRF